MGFELTRRLSHQWVQMTDSAPWHPRDGAHLVFWGGKLRIYGGWFPPSVPEWNNKPTTNEEWSSTDYGATWTRDYAHVESPPTSGLGAHWTRRHTAGWAQLGGHLYVSGGDYDNVVSDTWRTADGTTWERRSASAGWQGRTLTMMGALAHVNALYMMGGQTDLSDPGTALRDVWRSTDGGVTWTSLGNAPWLPRAMIYDLTEHRGHLWLIGGGTYGTVRDYYNDVWRFDGTTWTEVLPNGHSQFPSRQHHNVVRYSGRLWISGGYRNGGNRNDVYSSPDGETWTQHPATPWAIEHAAGLAATPNGLVHATGNALDQKVHRLLVAA